MHISKHIQNFVQQKMCLCNKLQRMTNCVGFHSEKKKKKNSGERGVNPNCIGFHLGKKVEK